MVATHATNAPKGRRKDKRRGYIVATFSLSVVLLLGVAGLGVDMGRLYVVKTEAQAFADAAAMNAAVSLAAKPGGFHAATNAVGQTPNYWDLGLRQFGSVTTLFGTSPTDTFVANPPAAGHVAADYTFAQVTVSACVPLYLMRIVVGSPKSLVRGRSVAGSMQTTNAWETNSPSRR